jgi:hypothetical protein
MGVRLWFTGAPGGTRLAANVSTMNPPAVAADEVMLALACLGWHARGMANSSVDGRPGWMVFGKRHGQRFHAEGATRDEAWWNAIVAAGSVDLSTNRE